jgi:phenylalanyl-tRNA synthetase beta chain
VMGGVSSEVSPDTRDVLLESAYFEPRSILRTSRRLQLLTEASTRFSRGTDPEGVGAAAARAAGLIVGWAGGEVTRGAIDVGGAPPRDRIGLRPSRAAAVLGYPVTSTDAIQALARIGIPAEEGDGGVVVEAPGFRPDLRTEEDVIEEIVRIQGYDRLPSTVPAIRGVGGEQDSYRVRRRLRELLVRAGLREASSLPFASEREARWRGEAEPVRVANPPAADAPFLRTSLLPSLLDAAARSLRRGARSVSLFEVGYVFRLGDPVDEREHLAFVLAGQVGEGLHAEDRSYDVLDAKGIVEAVLDGVGVSWRLEPGVDRPLHPAWSGTVFLGDRPVGVVGELHPAEGARRELPGRVGVAELAVEAMEIPASRIPGYRDVPRFPPVRRDLAFVIGEDVPAGVVRELVVAAGGELLDRAVLFDVFRGGSIPGGRRSLAFALEFRATDRTLTDEEVEPVVAAIVERVGSDLGGELRG